MAISEKSLMTAKDLAQKSRGHIEERCLLSPVDSSGRIGEAPERCGVRFLVQRAKSLVWTRNTAMNMSLRMVLSMCQTDRRRHKSWFRTKIKRGGLTGARREMRRNARGFSSPAQVVRHGGSNVLEDTRRCSPSRRDFAFARPTVPLRALVAARRSHGSL